MCSIVLVRIAADETSAAPRCCVEKSDETASSYVRAGGGLYAICAGAYLSVGRRNLDVSAFAARVRHATPCLRRGTRPPRRSVHS